MTILIIIAAPLAIAGLAYAAGHIRRRAYDRKWFSGLLTQKN